MLWIVYGLLHSLLRASFTEISRVSRIDPWKMAFWQAVFGLLLLLPFLPVMTWPAGRNFYMAAVGVSLIFTVGMLIQLTLSVEKKGRVSSVYMILEALAALVIWVVITGSFLHPQIFELLAAAGVVAAFLVAGIGLLQIRANDVNMQTFMIVAPVGLTYAVAGVVTKIVMPGYNVMGAALAYALVSFTVMAVVLGLVALMKKKISVAEMTETKTLKAGMLAGLSSALGYAAFVASVTYAPNPGYTSLLAMLLPVWLTGWHRYTKTGDLASARAAYFIIGGVVLLAVVTSL